MDKPRSNRTISSLYINVEDFVHKPRARSRLSMLPAHVDVLPPFAIDIRDAAPLAAALKKRIQSQPRVIGISTGERITVQGERGVQQARMIGGSALFELHHELLPIVARVGDVDESAVGDQYRPHVVLDRRDIHWGQNWREVPSLTMAARTPNGYAVIDTIDVKPPNTHFGLQRHISMHRERLDKTLLALGMVRSRSEAESWIRLGNVSVNGKTVTKAGTPVGPDDVVKLTASERYVSRAGLKLASVAEKLSVHFESSIVLDVGSSTGGFTDYALKHGASKVYAVDVGTDQLHPTLHGHPRIELHEKTDIRSFTPSMTPTVVVIDVSFISLREILPHIARLADSRTQIVAMLKPQFEAGRDQVNKGIIKNSAIRRQILKEFEQWTKQYFVIVSKLDSDVAGAKGNVERFYVLQTLRS